MNRTALAIVAGALLAGVLGYQIGQRWQADRAATPPSLDAEALIGAPAPEFSFPNLDGELRSLADYDGNVRVVNFWATWCAPCRREMPALNKLQRRLGERGFTVIGIALDEPDAVAAYVAELGVEYPIVVPETLAGMRYLNIMGNAAGLLPYTVFVDRGGRVDAVHLGELSAEEGIEATSRLL